MIRVVTEDGTELIRAAHTDDGHVAFNMQMTVIDKISDEENVELNMLADFFKTLAES